MDQYAVRILLIGLPAAGRLESVDNALRDLCAETQIEAAHSIASFQQSRSALETPPDLILVFQDWPDQYTPGEAD